MVLQVLRVRKEIKEIPSKVIRATLALKVIKGIKGMQVKLALTESQLPSLRKKLILKLSIWLSHSIPKLQHKLKI